jgi:hypothetical protein
MWDRWWWWWWGMMSWPAALPPLLLLLLLLPLLLAPVEVLPHQALSLLQLPQQVLPAC